MASNRAGPLTTDRVSRGLGGRLPASRGGSVPRRTEHPPARPTVLALLADPGSGSAGLNDYRLVLERVGRRGGSSPRLRPPGKPRSSRSVSAGVFATHDTVRPKELHAVRGQATRPRTFSTRRDLEGHGCTTLERGQVNTDASGTCAGPRERDADCRGSRGAL